MTIGFLILGPILVAVGNDVSEHDVFEGIMVTLGAIALMITGSYYRWVKPKNRSKLWLLFPGFLAVFGYIPLIIMGEKNWKKEVITKYLGRLPFWFDLRKKALLEDNIDIDRWRTNMEYLQTKDWDLREEVDPLVARIDDATPFLPPVLWERHDRNWFIAAYPDVIDYFYPNVYPDLPPDTRETKMTEAQSRRRKLDEYLSSKKLNQTLCLLYMKRFYKDELKRRFSLATE